MTSHLRFIRRASFALFLLAPAAASAQDTPTTGVVLGPNALSLIWHASDRVAVRPEVGLARSSSENDSGASQTSLILRPGVSVNFYTAQWDNVRAYISPAYHFQRIRSSSTTPNSTNPNQSQTQTSHNVSGSWGVEYAAHRRFAAFGELGIRYGRSTPEGVTVQSFSVISAIGAIFYF